MYDPFPLMMKKVVGIVLLSTVNSTLKTPCTSDMLPLKSFRIKFAFTKSSEPLPSFLNVATGIYCNHINETNLVNFLHIQDIHLSSLIIATSPLNNIKLEND
jgi:hypothetical protein